GGGPPTGVLSSCQEIRQRRPSASTNRCASPGSSRSSRSVQEDRRMARALPATTTPSGLLAAASGKPIGNGSRVSATSTGTAQKWSPLAENGTDATDR